MTGSHALVDSRCGRCGSPSDARVLRCGACGAPVALRAEWDSSKHPRGKGGKWGAGGGAAHPQGAQSAAAGRHADPAIAGAQATLEKVGVRVTAPIVTFKGPTLQGGGSAIQGETDGKTIRVNTNTRSYRNAQRGDTAELAASLAHEQYHVEHGPDEGPAYDEQVRVLQALGAAPSLVRETQAAKASVLKHAERWARLSVRRLALAERRHAREDVRFAARARRLAER